MYNVDHVLSDQPSDPVKGAVAARPMHHHTINPFVVVPDASAFIDFVTKVFGGRETTGVRVPDRDGSLIHAEVVVGDSTILLADRKPDWAFTPALLQVYVAASPPVLDAAVRAGATVVTPISRFYGGFSLARIRDPWRNLWWIYAPDGGPSAAGATSTTDWHSDEPSLVYTSLMGAMRDLAEPESR